MIMSDEIPFFKCAREFEERYNKREKENFTSLKSELWWFVRNCSEENFHEPLEDTDELTNELYKIVEKWTIKK
jgi:hypothetical protein